MISITTIQAEIDGLLEDLTTSETNRSKGSEEGVLTNAQISRRKGRIEFLKLAKNYLLPNPSEEFISGEINRLTTRTELIMKTYNQWITTEVYDSPAARLKDFEKLHQLPHIKRQLKALNYIYQPTPAT